MNSGEEEGRRRNVGFQGGGSSLVALLLRWLAASLQQNLHLIVCVCVYAYASTCVGVCSAEVKFIWHKANHFYFKRNHPMTFTTIKAFLKLVLKHFHQLEKESPYMSQAFFVFLSLHLLTKTKLCCLSGLIYSGHFISIKSYMWPFQTWLLLPSTVISGVICVVTCANTLFLFIAK